MDPRVAAAINTLRSIFGVAQRTVQARRNAVAGLATIAAILGIDPRVAAGPLLPRLTVADSVWRRIELAAAELEVGRAVLWYWGDRWLVVPRSAIPGGSQFLGGWQVVLLGVGAAAAVIALIIGAALLTNYWLEVRDSEAQNERLRIDALTQAQQLVTVACHPGSDPEKCRRATEAFRAIAAGLAPPTNGGAWPAAAAGAGGMALGLIVALLLSRRGSR